MKKTLKSAHHQMPPGWNIVAHARRPRRKAATWGLAQAGSRATFIDRVNNHTTRGRPAFGEVVPSVQKKGHNEFMGDDPPPDGTVFWEVGVDHEGGVLDVKAQIDANMMAALVRLEDKLDTLLAQRRRNA